VTDPLPGELAAIAEGTPATASRDGALETDAQVLDGLRQGDDRAYAALVRRHGSRMLAVASRLLGSEAEAEDAVQDAFLSAFRSLDGFNGQSRLGTWLHRIVVNAALMRLRTRRRRPETSIEELLPRFLENGHFRNPPQRWQDDPESLLQSADRKRWIRQKISTLPESYRTVLVLRDIENISTQETAELLGITPNAVKIRLHRARLALRESLDVEFRGNEL